MVRKPKGTKDILPKDVDQWRFVEQTFLDVCEQFGYKEIRTPIFEYTKLFKRGVGDSTDIVRKEMYHVVPSVYLRMLDDGEEGKTSFDKKLNKEGMTLRPEGTAPVIRAFVENKLYADQPLNKLAYISSCFRHERPQAGRQRQFHQFGIEALGASNASIDAEVIALADTFLTNVGFSSYNLEINSIGCPKCKPNYDKALREYLSGKLDKLCGDCHERYETNPMRVIDCKNPSCQAEITDIPVMIDYLCEECDEHFTSLKAQLDGMGVNYKVNPFIVRGLDYYNRTAFEFVSDVLGAQSTVCGGGRYDKLVEDIGGPETPGVGFGMGIERLLLGLEALNVEIPAKDENSIFIQPLDQSVMPYAMGVAIALRKMGLKVDIDHLSRSMKAQFKHINKRKIPYTIIIGGDEMNQGKIIFKDLDKGVQDEIQLENLAKIKEIVTGGNE